MKTHFDDLDVLNRTSIVVFHAEIDGGVYFDYKVYSSSIAFRALKPLKILIIDAVWGISVRIIQIVDAVWGIFIVFFVINQPNNINNISFRTTLEAPTDPETNFRSKWTPPLFSA